MWRSEWLVRVVFNEIGSPLSGHDVPCDDGKYRKCTSRYFDGARSETDVREELTKEFLDVYAFQFFGPYSNTSGS